MERMQIITSQQDTEPPGKCIHVSGESMHELVRLSLLLREDLRWRIQSRGEQLGNSTEGGEKESTWLTCSL